MLTFCLTECNRTRSEPQRNSETKIEWKLTLQLTFNPTISFMCEKYIEISTVIKKMGRVVAGCDSNIWGGDGHFRRDSLGAGQEAEL